MAIGDAIALFRWSSARIVQPASGAEAQITVFVKYQIGNGQLSMYDGTTLMSVLEPTTRTAESDPADVNAGRRNYYNMAIMITNSMYLYMSGGDYVYIGGVYTNA